MNILVSLNSNYIYPLCVMFNSIAKTNPGESLDVYVAYSSLTDEDFAKMERALDGTDFRIHPVFVKDELFADAPILSRTSKETYYRLLIGDILPENVHKILYLDPDVVINKNLNELYNIDVSDYVLAGGCHLFGLVEMGNLARLGLNPMGSYINAGILLINLDNWRKTVTLKDIFDFINRKHRLLLLADQDVINVLFEKHSLVIDERKYNLDEKTFKAYSKKKSGEKRIDLDWVRRNTTVIHYNGKHKPWLEENYGGKLGEYFEKYKNI